MTGSRPRQRINASRPPTQQNTSLSKQDLQAMFQMFATASPAGKTTLSEDITTLSEQVVAKVCKKQSAPQQPPTSHSSSPRPRSQSPALMPAPQNNKGITPASVNIKERKGAPRDNIRTGSVPHSKTKPSNTTNTNNGYDTHPDTNDNTHTNDTGNTDREEDVQEAQRQTLQILQWNRVSISNKHHLPMADAYESNWDVILLQETGLPQDTQTRFSGYTAYHLPAIDRQTRGCSILVKSCIPSQKINHPVDCGDRTEVLGITPPTQHGPIQVYNIYNKLWTISSRSVSSLPSAQQQVWNTKKADWPRFREEILHHLAQTESGLTADDLEHRLVDAFHHAANKAIPKTKKPTHNYKDRWYYDQRVKEYNHRINQARKLNRTHNTETTRGLLRAAIRTAREGKKAIKTEKWLEWCSGMNAHTTLSDLWKHVKTATGKRTLRAPTHPDPEREAARLLQTYVNRASPAQLSPASLAKLEEQRPARDTFIQQACRQRYPADTAFTPQELQKALRPRPDTAAGADKIISMIRKGGSKILCYADDIAIITTGPLHLQKAQNAITAVAKKCNSLGLKINFEKTKAMYFNGGRPHAPPQGHMSIVDYAAPLLATISPYKMEDLEKTPQMKARIMLGAPRWTKLVNTRAEADLPLLAHRIHAMNTSLLAKTLSQTKYTTAARKVHQSLAHNEELFTKKTWAQKMAQGIKTLQMQTPLTATITDAQHLTINHLHGKRV
ncbi:hypothetical protein O3P69_018252 [Scylla paramamosain]|uniref:Reverse transcriptase domain-containing protein n=1 Tax=Scylla paramamosain TaxID=85552 RepID=A0AAW0TIQ8_SCYPA